MTTGTTPHVVVIGGGIAGLAAAFFLRDEPVRVTLLEGSPRLGGKLSASEVAGVPVDEGAETIPVAASSSMSAGTPMNCRRGSARIAPRV